MSWRRREETKRTIKGSAQRSMLSCTGSYTIKKKYVCIVSLHGKCRQEVRHHLSILRTELTLASVTARSLQISPQQWNIFITVRGGVAELRLQIPCLNRYSIYEFSLRTKRRQAFHVSSPNSNFFHRQVIILVISCWLRSVLNSFGLFFFSSLSQNVLYPPWLQNLYVKVDIGKFY